MRRISVSVIVIAMISGLFIATPASATELDIRVTKMLSEERADSSVIFATDEGIDPNDTVVGELGFSFEEISEDSYVLRLPWWSGLRDVLTRLLSDSQIRFAEPNYVFESVADPVTDDPRLTDLWGLGADPGANAYGAWDLGVTGSENVVIAVLDTGIDYTHPDLAANMWVNEAELNGSPGADDDGNGLVDDIHGYDFYNDVGNVLSGPDEDKHGTHVAGTIAAVGNNSVGVTGMAWNTKLISVKVLHDGSGSSLSVLYGLRYVEYLKTQQGVNIVATNNSYGGPHYSQALEEAIARTGNAGILFVASAGNSTANLELTNSFPASLSCVSEVRDFDCLISVAASNQSGNLADFSNFGATKVDLAAPGTSILSTVVQRTDPDTQELIQYEYAQGTSMAAPHVTGAIALCAAANPGMSAGEIRSAILATATPKASLAGTSVTGGILNAGALVQSCLSSVEASMTGAPTQFHATATYTDRIRLEWSDDAIGEHGYTITYGSGPTGCTTATANHLAYIGPGLNGYEVFDLEESTMYCFSIKATRGAQSSTRVTSNLTITFTSNLPYISGTLLMDDGVTPVENAFVYWSATPGNGVGGYSDANGFYKVQATPDVTGNLVVLGPSRYFGSLYVQTTPRLPLSFKLNGSLAVSTDTTVDLTFPEFNTISITAESEVDGSAVAGAKISAQPVSTDSTACSLSKNDWRPSSLLEPIGGRYCSYSLPDQYVSRSVAELDGTYSFEVLDAFQQSGTGATFPIKITATDAANSLIAGRIQVTTDTDSTTTLTMLQPKTVTGTVTLFGGTEPLSGAKVTAGSKNATTGVDGSYSIQMSKLDQTQMTVSMLEADEGLVPPTMTLQGYLAADATGPVDWELPELNTVTVQVKDALTEESLASALVSFRGQYTSTLGCMLSAADYSPSSALTYGLLRPCRYSGYEQLANQAGEATFQVLDGFYQNGNADFNLIFSTTHPSDVNRAGEVIAPTATSNTAILSIGGNPVISGTVLMYDEVTPLQNGLITYETETFSTSVRTDANGQYSITVPSTVPGKLYLKQSENLKSAYPTGEQTTPEIPLGFELGGNITPIVDVTVDLVLPQLRTFNLTVRDANSEEPVEHGEVFLSLVSGDGFYCGVSSNDYNPSPNLTYGVRACIYRPAGYVAMPALTDASGQISLVMIDGWYQAANTAPVRIRVQHPDDGARVGEVVVASNQDQTLIIDIPGTPSRPEQPSVVADADSVTLTWDEPWNGGAFIDYYRVYISNSAGGPFELVTSGTCAGDIAPELRSCTVTGLTIGNTYYFAIVAFNVVGASDFSVAAMSTLQPDPDPTAEPDPTPDPEPTEEPTADPPVVSPPTNPAPPVGGTPAGGTPVAQLPPTIQSPALSRATELASLPDGAKLEHAEDAGALHVKGETWTFSFMSPDMTVAETGLIGVPQGSSTPVEISGYGASSKVEIFLEAASFSAAGQLSELLFRAMTRVSIGSFETDATGTLTAEFAIPSTVTSGTYAMVVQGTDSDLRPVTFSLPIELIQSVDFSFAVWTKKLGANQAKMYAKSPSGVGKIQFMLNGKEIAWVRAVDGTDPKLRRVTEGPMAGVDYLVRTVDFIEGKNALEIYQDGVRIWRAAYTLN